MKKAAIGVLVILMAMAGSVSAQDLTGVFCAGVFVDYGIGFGTAFDDVESSSGSDTFKGESKLSYSFGALFRYNFKPELGIIVSVDNQVWDFDYTYNISGFSGTESESESWICIAADIAYYLSAGEKTQPYVAAGPGVYIYSHEDADTKFGFNGTIGVIHFFSEKIALDARGRFHMIPSAYAVYDPNAQSVDEEAITAFQIQVGASYFFFPN